MRRFQPHDYQKDGIGKIVEHEALALWWEPGLGKTVTTLTAIKELKFYRWQVSKVLIIAPLKVAESTWQDELKEWSHLSGWFSVATMIGTAKQRIAAYEQNADITVINRDNVKWLVDYSLNTANEWKFDMVVIDEASSFKNPSSQRFKSLRKVRGRIRRVVELTGTPSGKDLGDLWSQVYLLDQGERLYRTVTQFRVRYFTQNLYTYQYTLLDGAEDQIMEKLKDVCFSLSAKDWLQLPEFVEEDVPVCLSEKQLAEYRRFERTFVLSLLDDEDGKILASSAAVLSSKLLQYASGAVYDENGSVHELHDEKRKAFGEIVELAAEPILVFYNFRFDLVRICDELEKQKKKYRVYRSDDDLRMWNAGELDVLVASPQSCGYGLNLQKGGRRILWYTLPWSYEVYRQANARLYRQGQTKPVLVQSLIARGTYDERVRLVLAAKLNLHEYVMNFVRSVVEESEE